MEREPDGLVAALGAIAALGTALVLSPLRDSIGLANVALLLTLVVVAAGIVGGRIAGATTAVVAALGFNALHTRPYGTLRIDRPADVLTCVLMVIVGVAVGQLAHWSARRARGADRNRAGIHDLSELAQMVADRAPGDDIVERAAHHLVGRLRLADCRFEAGDAPGDGTRPPDLDHRFTIDGGLRAGSEGFELPVGGVSLPVRAGGTVVGRFVMVPRSGAGVTPADREVALLIADIVARALSDGSRA